MLTPAAKAWTRFAARIIDFSIFSFVFGFLSVFIAPGLINQPDVIVNVEILFAWVFVETFLLYTWGLTPGKWLLQISVKNESNNKLTISEAFTRSVFVFFVGMGMGLPVLIFLTWVLAYLELTKQGMTKWDKKGKFIVFYQENSVVRIAVAVLIILFHFGINIYYSIG